MRIVGGKHSGRPLSPPKGSDTRPTSDRAREAIFNVLSHGPGPGFTGANIADLFAGTGALGLEALSRGAAHATFVEHDRSAGKVLMANIQALNEQPNCQVLTQKAADLWPPDSGPMDYVFLDAPYNQGLSEPALIALAQQGWLKDGSILMVEIAKGETLDLPPSFALIKEKKYGAARVLFLEYGL